jgi:hypothetical protein
MKNVFLLLVFCISFAAVSQEIKRKDIAGKIVVEGNDLEGITVYNTASKIGSVTNDKGEFTIAVALNDLIEIRALEYQNVDVKITQDVLNFNSISVFLIEEVNRLDEIVFTAKTKKFTGNLNTDIDKVKTFRPKSNIIYFGIKNPKINNTVLNNTNLTVDRPVETLVNGLNIVNVVDQLLIPLFRSEVKDKKSVGVPEVPAESIKYYLGSNFLVENFNIPEHRVEEFIRYVEDDKAFDFNLLNYGNELELLELISEKSKMFLKK